MTVPSGGLPHQVEQALINIRQLPEEHRRDAVEALCARYPEHRNPILELLAPAPSDTVATPGTALAPPSAAPQRIGPFQILDTLGEGGMGTVYLAEQKEPVRRRVALKVIKLGMDSKQVVSRFELERQALAVMNHPAIAKVFEAGITAQGQPFFVMEFVEGMPLTDYCDQHKLGLKERIAIFQQVCRGVQHAHQKGVVHRDLKPGNVLVARKGDEHAVKIIDFGLARATDHQLVDHTIYTEQGAVIGTPEYMSPEQASGVALDIDTRTDVYSLGVILYELLTGELPFTTRQLRAKGILEIQRLLQEVEPDKPSTRISSAGDAASTWASRRQISVTALRRQLRGDLDWIVLRAMAKEPERRYGSALGLALDLGRYLDHEPVEAGPPSAVYRVSKLVRKYRIQVTAALLVLLVALAGAVVALQYARIARKNETEAKRQAALAQAAQGRSEQDAAEARRQATLAEAERNRTREEKSRFDRLSVVVQLEAAKAGLAGLQPAWPAKIPAMREWLRLRGDKLERELPEVRKILQDLRAKASPPPEREKAPEPPALTRANQADEFLFKTLQRVEGELVAFLGKAGERIEVQRRLAWAERVDNLTTAHPNARVSWSAVREALRKADGVTASELYAARHHADHPIALTPQTGLVPIGMNPKTKLWEFYHLRSAYDPRTDVDPAALPIPQHESDGSIPMTARTGIVFVLLPGGTFTMGAQGRDPTAAHYDPHAEPDEAVTTQTVAPFFLARHELTQGQWMRLSIQANPSRYPAGTRVPPRPVTLAHPVEQVDWEVCNELMTRHRLQLPDESSWEYGCRAGSETPWFPGKAAADLLGYANVLDRFAKERAPSWTGEVAPFRDGHVIHAPVGTFQANPFGLFDVHGNVREWCRDVYSTTTGFRVYRGGGFVSGTRLVRSSHRYSLAPTVRATNLGLRPARARQE